ncbi:MAG: orotidine-5'-phosphate decarboxylase [Planctomycetota bacterium]|nr:orotidine-5'-phosphate decarboxylase [Planctomycetota bacterium]
MNYADRLTESVRRAGNPCLVGLDPHEASLPEEFAVVRDPNAPRAAKAQACADFLCAILEVCAGKVPAVKPQSAFFEIYGADGALAWERVVSTAKQAGLIVIGDVKRGDIDTTAKAYARAFLEGSGPRDREHLCDAITINPYLGSDSITPFLESCKAADAGIYVLVRTSNKDSKLIQDHGSPRVYEKVADSVVEWGKELIGTSGLSSVGAVVGATHPDELTALRARMPTTPFLIPGYGAQGAGAKEIVGGFLRGGRGALVNSSRGILFASKQQAFKELHWKDAAARAIDAMASEINAAVGFAS